MHWRKYETIAGEVSVMAFKISVPSKTFLLGEYLVLNGGPSILLSTAPRFKLEIGEHYSKNQDAIFNENSPAGLFMEKHKDIFKSTRIDFYDPYNGSGGFGASSAQYLMLALYENYYHQRKIDIDYIIKEYFELSQSNSLYQLSGADVLSQISGGILYFCKNKKIKEKFSWPFYNLSYALINTDNKIATHEHLHELQKINTDDLYNTVNIASNSICKNDTVGFCNAINLYHDQLAKKGFIHKKTQDIIDCLKGDDSILAAKGCGALGGDVILSVFEKKKEASVKASIRKKNLDLITIGQEASMGFDMDMSSNSDAKNQDIILVDKNDHQVGLANKMSVHEKGLLHRAFSIFVFRDTNNFLEILLQKRSSKKYHCANLWTNTCCSHARPGEDIILTAEKRLQEEFGFTLNLYEVGYFSYCARLENNLIENEYDHVFIGKYTDENIKSDPEEINKFEWVSIESLLQNLNNNPRKYTPWLKQALDIALQKRYLEPLFSE